jgi:hypothetical protein
LRHGQGARKHRIGGDEHDHAGVFDVEVADGHRRTPEAQNGYRATYLSLLSRALRAMRNEQHCFLPW